MSKLNSRATTRIVEERLRLAEAYLGTLGSTADLIQQAAGDSIPMFEEPSSFANWVSQMCAQAVQQLKSARRALPAHCSALEARRDHRS
jgi:hypothetical protein